jgi:ribosome-binding factor A
LNKMKFKRSHRVSELIKREVSTIISFVIKDPLLKTVNITFVKVSDDLKHAKIYYRVIGDEQTKENALKGLERAKKFIRSEIGQRTELRYVPEIQFFYDTGIDAAAHIDLLLKQIKNSDTS